MTSDPLPITHDPLPPGSRPWSRPLLWLTVAFCVGIAAQRSLDLPKVVILPASCLLLACLAAGLFERFYIFRSPPFAILFFFELGVLAGFGAVPPLPAPSSLEPFFDRPQVLFLAKVFAPPDILPDKTQLSLELEKAYIDEKTVPIEGGVLLTLLKTRSEPSGWVLGDRLLVRLTLKRFHNFENPGGFDYVRSQAERGLFARAHLADDRSLIKLASEPSPFYSTFLRFLGSRLDRFRQEALFWLRKNLDSDPAAFYAALLLGYRVPRSWAEHLNRTGVSHLLSISGLHMGLVGMSVFWLARRLIRLSCPSVLKRTSDQHIALWAALAAAVLYALISGLALPTWRSLIMLTLFFAAAFRYRSSDSLTALAASALLVLFFSANALWQISFQLSFAAMFGLFILYPIFRRFQASVWDLALAPNHLGRRILHPFVDAFWVSMAANIMVLPLTIFHFSGISLAGFLANTLLVPLVGFLVLQPGLAALAIYPFSEGLATPVLKVGGWFLGYCQDAILWFSHLSWAYFYVGSIPLIWLAGFYCGLFILLASWRRQTKAAGFSLLILVVFGAAPAVRLLGPLLSVYGLKNPGVSLRCDSATCPLMITLLDVGQGTSALVRFPGGETMLIDGGGFFDDSYNVGRYVLAPALWASGIRRIDRVVLSHDHPDHRNGLRFILSQFDVGEFWESGVAEKSSGAENSNFPEGLAAIALKRKIPIRRAPEILGGHEIGSCKVDIVHPYPSYIQTEWDGRDLNNVSLVVRIDYGKTRFILPGDIDRSVESYLFDNEGEPCGETILVSPHHGSEHSNGAILFNRLNPRAVIFTCGYDNWFNFPSPAVLERCAKLNIPTYRTDINGAVHAESDGRKWTITSESDGNIHARKDLRQ